jgi:hypothetical protein
MSTQSQFLNAIIKLIPKEFHPTHWLSDTLGINHSSAFKKLKGITSLSWTDIDLICRALPEATHLLPESLGSGMGFGGQLNSFESQQDLVPYFNQTTRLLQTARRAQHELRYVGRDLTFFFFLSRPELLSFKIAIWSHRLFTHGVEPLSLEVLRKSQQLFEVYKHINSKELWFEQGMVNFTAQLRIAVLGGFVEERLAHEICQVAHLALCDFALYALDGTKEGGSKFELFQIPFCTLPNSALLEIGNQRVLLSSIADARYFSTVAQVPIAAFNKGYQSLERFATSLKEPGANHLFFEQHKNMLRQLPKNVMGR